MTPIEFRGVYAAVTTPFTPAGDVDFATFEKHCANLVECGVAGIVPNGSLGEYEAMDDAERAKLVDTAVFAVGTKAPVVPGISGKSAGDARRWAEQAASSGCPAVMCLPPTSHAPTPDETVAHFAEVARAGLPIIAYNNPFSTRADLTPDLLARLSHIDLVVAVKEFSQDVRRVARIMEEAPRLQVMCGCDDTLVESMLMGAVGWIAGFANALPRQSVQLYSLCESGRWADAVALYRLLLPLLRLDADPSFVQAIKIAQSEAGLPGGPVRLPRLPLVTEEETRIRALTRAVLSRTTSS
jgi:dihydrodipicolinate synthase/N-acetylneuraminate lyase